MSAGRTAMVRSDLSRPVTLALQDNILRPGDIVFDYGCGRGGDVRRLTSAGFSASGWDPAHFPAEPRRAADVVNLGFVVNVIREPTERAAALRAAWSLAKRTLVVAARPDWEARGLKAQPDGDGWVTSAGTFQRFYRQDELKSWLEAVLGTPVYAAAPGVFYIFKDAQEAQRFRAKQVRATSAKLHIDPGLLPEAEREAFSEFLDFILRRGRAPGMDELEHGKLVIRAFGSLRRVEESAATRLGPKWPAASARARTDLQVYLSLSALSGRPSWSGLPAELQRDIRKFFGSYKAAVVAADELLFSAGDQHCLDQALAESKIGKRLPDALYVHVSALETLHPVLRVYEGCARTLVGHVASASVLKLQRVHRRVAYLSYPDFDRVAHPELRFSLRADLRTFDVNLTDYTDSGNPPILHRKEVFVGHDYPRRELFARLSRQEERAGLLGGNDIGNRRGWLAALEEAGQVLRGHRLVRAHVSMCDESPQPRRTSSDPTYVRP